MGMEGLTFFNSPSAALGARLFPVVCACPDPTVRLPGGVVQLRLHKGTQPRVLPKEGSTNTFPK